MTDHDTAVKHLERLLRDRVLDINPDLEARAADGVRAGSRLRRRRRLWGAVSASAAVMAVVALGTQLNIPLGSTSPSSGFASDPRSTGSPSATPTSTDCPKTAPSSWKQESIPAPSASMGPISKAAKQRLARHYARLASSAPTTAACKKNLRDASLSPGPTSPEQLPVFLAAPSWTCTTPGDDKFTCTNGTASIVVTVRPANEHHAYLHDPDKASPDQYVSDVHGKVFATLERPPAEHRVSVEDLGQQLVWR